jgi:ATP-dependent RNA helicase SUPV3L1/SUV3
MPALDRLTGGAFTAATAGERANRVRAWLASDPPTEQIAEVFKLLANRDKGAARPLREKLDELRRAKEQEAVVADWAAKAQHLLDLPKLNPADALAWQRDAAKAGAPLSREPLTSLKTQLAERVRIIEDLQHRTQVQREAAVLIAQRTEVLSTKSWKDAQAAWEGLNADVAAWQAQAEALKQDPIWPSVDLRFPPLLESARAQLLAVWDAFQAALAQAVAASADPDAGLPAVPVWADELRAVRGEPLTEKPVRAKVDPAVLAQQRAAASAGVSPALEALKKELAEGHGKATPKAAADLRQALKDHARHLDAALEADAHATLGAAGELEGWQRWRADQIRDELVAKAQALVEKPLGGRKQQEALRALREQWKTSDQGGAANHALWKRFDEACNLAHKVVEAWLEKTREQQEASRAQRRALMDELRAWTETHQGNADWKLRIRALHGFEQRWREAGHLSEKAFAEMNTLWKPLMDAAESPLNEARQLSLARRRAMIEEAQALGAEALLRIDAVKALQQRWQQEAQVVPLERRQEQKLWDAFRKPIDEAFQRKSEEREKAAQALGEHDRQVIAAAKAVQEANACGDAHRIQAAVKALEAAVRGQKAELEAQAAAAQTSPAAPAESAPAAQAPAAEAAEAGAESGSEATVGPEAAAPAPAAKTPPKPVVAMRGDDRPGARRPETAAARPGKFERRDARPGERTARPGDNRFERRRDETDAGRGRFGDRGPAQDRGPRLGDAAFRAQREALENAQLALRKLASQAHGEVLTQLMTAWEQRDPDLMPPAQALGKAVPSAVRSQWVSALGAPAAGDSSAAEEPLLRLEIGADLPTPAEHLSARRMLQLQLLTRRNAAAPAQTWGEDLARVFAAAHDAAHARRVQNVLKALFRR